LKDTKMAEEPSDNVIDPSPGRPLGFPAYLVRASVGLTMRRTARPAEWGLYEPGIRGSNGNPGD
jgi:hypothetical protein